MNLLTSAIDMADGIAHYLERLRRRGRAANTMKCYDGDLQQFLTHVRLRAECTLVALIATRSVSSWLDRMSAEGVSPRSQARKLTVLRCFFKFCKAEGWTGHDPTAGESVRWRARRVTAPEMGVLLAMVEGIGRSNRIDRRDRAMLRLALDGALRISEVAGLDIPGSGSQAVVDLPRRLVHITGKGGDTQTVAINDTTVRAVEDWLQARDGMAGEGVTALFVSTRGTRLSRQALHVVCKRRGEAAGLTEMHWHLLRHRRLGEVYEQLGPKIAQAHARHSSSSTTEAVYGAHSDSVTRALIRKHADLDARAAA